MSYNHLSIQERELIAIYRAKNLSICKIAKVLGRNKATISRELARNPGEYLPSKAQARYRRRRMKCRPHKLLENPDLFALVKKLFLDCHWSPEQISNRLKFENYPIQLSYKTIYRAIYAAINVLKAIAGRYANFGIVASRADQKAMYQIAEKFQSATS